MLEKPKEWQCTCGQHGLFILLGGGLIECPQCHRRFIVTSTGRLVRIYQEVSHRG